jgi:hypothetical protein
MNRKLAVCHAARQALYNTTVVNVRASVFRGEEATEIPQSEVRRRKRQIAFNQVLIFHRLYSPLKHGVQKYFTTETQKVASARGEECLPQALRTQNEDLDENYSLQNFVPFVVKFILTSAIRNSDSAIFYSPSRLRRAT